MFEPTFNDEIEYVSVTRQIIDKMLSEWGQEIQKKRKEPLSEQAAQDIKREIEELMQISKILSEVSINPKIDPLCEGVVLY